MGRLSSHDEWTSNHNGQLARDQTGWRWINLKKADREGPASGDREGGKGRLRDRPIGWGRGGGDRGRHSCRAQPLSGALAGIGLGVSTH